MKYAALLTLLTCVSLVTFSQTPGGSSSPTQKCSLTHAQSPEIRGIRLGMTAEQLLALFPDDITVNESMRRSTGRSDLIVMASADSIWEPIPRVVTRGSPASIHND